MRTEGIGSGSEARSNGPESRNGAKGILAPGAEQGLRRQFVENSPVVFTYDASTGSLTNTGFAGYHQLGEDGLLVIAVDEGDQFGEDLNGDGDIQDQIVHVLRIE